jgi:hypothetical protein
MQIHSILLHANPQHGDFTVGNLECVPGRGGRQVLKPYTHRGAPIVYSLGNFAFDYFPVDPPQWTGWVAKLTFRPSGPVDLETRAVILDPAGLPHPVVVDEPTAAPATP